MRGSTSYCRCAPRLWKINWRCWGNTGSTTPARSTGSCSAWRPYSNTGRGQNRDRRPCLAKSGNVAVMVIVGSLTRVIVMSDWCCSPQVSEGVRGAQPVAAVCSGASGVLEYAGRAGSSGAGKCQRPSRCLSGEAAPFLSFLTSIDLDGLGFPAHISVLTWDFIYLFLTDDILHSWLFLTGNSRRPNEILKKHLSSKSIC